MNPLIKWPGGKSGEIQKIRQYIPEKDPYVEPFFGSGAVLFNKPVSDIETINDLDHDVVNIFRFLIYD